MTKSLFASLVGAFAFSLLSMSCGGTVSPDGAEPTGADLGKTQSDIKASCGGNEVPYFTCHHKVTRDTYTYGCKHGPTGTVVSSHAGTCSSNYPECVDFGSEGYCFRP